MNENEIRKYAALMRELDLTGLEIDAAKGVIRIEREKASSPAVPHMPEMSARGETAAAAPVSEATSAVVSPMVGVFYAAPSEDAEPFVKVGDTVRRGEVLCIIEAMKLMNEITAERDGIVTEVCATNGQIVEFGAELFRIKETAL